MSTDNGKPQDSSKSDSMMSNQEQRSAPEAARDTDVHKSKDSINKKSTPSDDDRRKQSSKLSRQALAAQKKAHELRQAANGAADPDERQHLMEEAINAQVEAESFGKTAKYLQSGTFQGMVVGTGIGTAPGLTLGTLTGTLVGGTTSLIMGGLGGAIGAATGWLHGPFWNMGKLAGKGIRKVTGDLPGWKATDEQKAALEKMIGQVNEQESPNEADLSTMAEWEEQTRDDGQTQTWAEYGASYLPSTSAGQELKPKKSDKAANSSAKTEQKKKQAAPKRGIEPDQNKSQPDTRTSDNDLQQASNQPRSARAEPRSSNGDKVDAPSSQQKPTANGHQASPSLQSRNKPRKIRQQQPALESQKAFSSQPRKTPRKLEVRKQGVSSPQIRKAPRKLETRKQDVR